MQWLSRCIDRFLVHSTLPPSQNPFLLPWFSVNRTFLIHLLYMQLFISLFITRSSSSFFPVFKFRCPFRVLLLFCLFSVEVTTIMESTLIFVSLIIWTAYDSWHCLFPWLLFYLSVGSSHWENLLSLHIQYVPNSVHHLTPRLTFWCHHTF